MKLNLPFTCVALECGRVDDVVQLGSAPGALASWLADADDGANQRCENASDDDGNAKKCSQAGAAEHAANNEAHGRYDEAKEQAGECVLGRGFLWRSDFSWCELFMWLDLRTAGGAEGPGRGHLRTAFLTVVGHCMALPVDEKDSTDKRDKNRTSVTMQAALTCGVWRACKPFGRYSVRDR